MHQKTAGTGCGPASRLGRHRSERTEALSCRHSATAVSLSDVRMTPPRLRTRQTRHSAPSDKAYKDDGHTGENHNSSNNQEKTLKAETRVSLSRISPPERENLIASCALQASRRNHVTPDFHKVALASTRRHSQARPSAGAGGCVSSPLRG